MSLSHYRKKRNFKKTTEPPGKALYISSKRANKFVIQKHAASHLHYDFRLEINGVLKSWSVPKGPSLNPAVKRLAIETEDHPLEYASFEGIIPQGSYGGGTVMIWDYGFFKNIKSNKLDHCYRQGHIEIWLEGEKLTGGFALIFLREVQKRRHWLLIKMKDEKASLKANPVNTKNRSAKSKRTMKQIEMDAKKIKDKHEKP